MPGMARRRGGPARRHRLPWVSDAIALSDRLGTTETTAQVDPGRFTRAMMRAAAAHGAELRRAAVTGIARRDGAVAAVETDEGAIATDAVVIAMGPWSRLAAEWLPLPPVYGLKGHSLVFETGSRLPAEALFIEYRGGARRRAPRPRCSRAPTARPMSARFRRESPVPLDPADGARPTPARSSASRRSAGRCRRCWPRARSLRARPATAR